MAWQARIMAIAKLGNDPTKVNVNVDYFDDAVDDPQNPGNPLVQFQKTFQFAVDTKAADMRATIVADGANAKACVARVTTLLAAAPVGTLLPIP
jgi:hypothetical protein